MNLTSPLIVQDIRTFFERDARGKADEEIDEWLRVEERALRTLYGVTRTDTEADAVMRDAMLAAWPSFIQQVRQVASETAGASSYSVTFNRAGGSDFAFPSFVAAMLGGVADAAVAHSAPSSTQLVR